MPKRHIALPGPWGRAISLTLQSCLCLDLKILPLSKKPPSPPDFASWAPNFQGMSTKSGGMIDGTLRYPVLLHSVWTGAMEPGSYRGSCRGLETQDTVDLMKLGHHRIKSDTKENDQNSRHGSHSRNRYNMPLSLYMLLFEDRLELRGK